MQMHHRNTHHPRSLPVDVDKTEGRCLDHAYNTTASKQAAPTPTRRKATARNTTLQPDATAPSK
jgi:hypothetical protein